MIRGKGPSPALVIPLVEALPDTSMTVALMSGGPQFRGWSEDRSLFALIYDAIQQNTLATGNWKQGKEPTFKPYPRPSGKGAEESKKNRPSLSDIQSKLFRR